MIPAMARDGLLAVRLPVDGTLRVCARSTAKSIEVIVVVALCAFLCAGVRRIIAAVAARGDGSVYLDACLHDRASLVAAMGCAGSAPISDCGSVAAGVAVVFAFCDLPPCLSHASF